MPVANEATHSNCPHNVSKSKLSRDFHLFGKSWRRLESDSCLPADVVGLARGLQFQTVGSLLFFVRADRNDGLPPAFRACRLIVRGARAEQHAVAVFRRNLWGRWIKFPFQSRFFDLYSYILISAILKKTKTNEPNLPGNTNVAHMDSYQLDKKKRFYSESKNVIF